MATIAVSRRTKNSFAATCPRCDYEFIGPSTAAVLQEVQAHLVECSDDEAEWKRYDPDDEADKRAAAMRARANAARAAK